MARIAVICLSSSGKIDIIRCIRDYFFDINCSIFLHVDKKTSVDAYSSLIDGVRVVLVRPRKKVYWGGFQMVEAVIQSIEFSIEFGTFDRFVLISDDTIPLRSTAYFHAAMSTDQDFIVASPAKAEWIRKRYEGFFCYDDLSTCPRTPPDQRVIESTLLEKLVRLENLRKKGKVALDMLYHGATWWALKRATLEVIIQSYQKDLHLRESFEFSANPDEQYIQTIFGSTFGGLINPLMISDFTRDPKPFVFSDPAEIVREACKQPCFFIRKVTWSEGINDFVNSLRTHPSHSDRDVPLL